MIWRESALRSGEGSGGSGVDRCTGLDARSRQTDPEVQALAGSPGPFALTCAALSCASAVLLCPTGNAQDYESITRELTTIEGQADALSREPVTETRSPTFVEERLTDGELFYRLQDYIHAAIILTDVVELLDQLVVGVQTSADFQRVWRQLQKTMAKRVLKVELTHHLGYPEGGKRGPDGNVRNGFPPKSLLTASWAIALEISRDRDGSFTPQFGPKGARRLPSFDEMMLMLYARGLSTRELQAFLVERYQIPVSPDLISTITSEVLAEVETGQQRPLEATYVAVAFDALRVKICDEGVVQNKAVYLALGVQLDGTRGGDRLSDRADRGRRLLTSRVSRAAGPRRHRHPHRADRWPDGLPGALQTVRTR